LHLIFSYCVFSNCNSSCSAFPLPLISLSLSVSLSLCVCCVDFEKNQLHFTFAIDFSIWVSNANNPPAIINFQVEWTFFCS
jgi:hypothetical protein